MSWNDVLLWFVALSSLIPVLSGVLPGRSRSAPQIILSLMVLVATGGLYLWRPEVAGYIGGALYFVLLLVPALIARWVFRRSLAQNYHQAAQGARWLHRLFPFYGWGRTAEFFHGIDVAWRGDLKAAEAIFARLADDATPDGRNAAFNLRRIRNEWPALREWFKRPEIASRVERDPGLVAMLLRTLGECGEVSELVNAFERHSRPLQQPGAGILRDLCRLYVLSFTGRVGVVERLCATTLGSLPPAVREFWIGTAESMAGNTAASEARFAAIDQAADGFTRQALAWRRRPEHANSGMSGPAERETVDRLERELAAEERVGTRPGILTPRRRVTCVLLAVNVAIFVGATTFGETPDGNRWIALGVLDTWAVDAGQWWRLLTSTVLHANTAHLLMNLFALHLLGPFVETNLRWLRFLGLYLLAGAGSMAFVHLLHRHEATPYFALGASGSIMGLVGASAAIFLEEWRRERARSVFLGLRRVLLAMALQTVFDLATPRISFAAHLAGFTLGFLVALLMLAGRFRRTNI
jgi:rhomboid protease GluP